MAPPSAELVDKAKIFQTSAFMQSIFPRRKGGDSAGKAITDFFLSEFFLQTIPRSVLHNAPCPGCILDT